MHIRNRIKVIYMIFHLEEGGGDRGTPTRFDSQWTTPCVAYIIKITRKTELLQYDIQLSGGIESFPPSGEICMQNECNCTYSNFVTC